MTTKRTIFTALLEAQRAFKPALKQSVNPHFRSRYADLSAVVDAVIDGLNDNGIVLVQKTHECDDGVKVETLFVHESGEMMSCGVLHVPAAKADPQGYGSALTYARRYSLMAACGIAPEDDDGNAASKPVGKPVEKKQVPVSGREAGTKRASPTVYDISSLSGDQRAAAVTYLLANSAKQIDEHTFKSPIKLEKLTQFIVVENEQEKV